jgi:hypothetical protein
MVNNLMQAFGASREIPIERSLIPTPSNTTVTPYRKGIPGSEYP